MRTLRSWTPSLLALSLAACGAEPAPEGPDGAEAEDLIAVDDDKADNFLSKSAIEYVVSGSTTVTLEPSFEGKPEAERLARARQLVSLKQVAITWFLNEYLIEKEAKEGNDGWGEFHALSKNDHDALDIRAESGLTYRFSFRQLIAGKTDLLRVIPSEAAGTGKRKLVLPIGRPSNEEMARLETNAEWYRNAPWDEWDPRDRPADEVESLELILEKERPSVDGYLDYARLFADGKVTIGVHFGWDYHSAYHIKHAEAFYRWLVTRGFASPVSEFGKYTRTSGPLTKTLSANGRDVTAEISLFWGAPGTDTDPDTDDGGKLLENDVRQSFAEREVIVYSGHSGPLYGFALANWRKTAEGDLDDSEMASVAMPAGTYQVVLAEGCDTYSVGSQLLANPAKGGKDLDVVTTTAPSNASSPEAVQLFVDALLSLGARGTTAHRPRLWSEALESLDGASSWFHTMYGVHGIDDNPHRHPYANLERAGQSCRSNVSCGGTGNACVRQSSGARQCAYACTADDGCGTGFRCQAVASGSSITGKMCMRR